MGYVHGYVTCQLNRLRPNPCAKKNNNQNVNRLTAGRRGSRGEIGDTPLEGKVTQDFFEKLISNEVRWG